MPFEKGNQLGAKQRLFDGALRRAIAQDDGARLRAAAETLLTLAAQGEAWAVKELADRLDGKATQTIAGDKDAPLTINWPVPIPNIERGA